LRVGWLLLSLSSFNSANAQQLVPVLLSYRKVFQLQKESMYYRPTTYYLAFCTINIPIAAVETFLFLLVVYPLSGLRGGLGSDHCGYCTDTRTCSYAR